MITGRGTMRTGVNSDESIKKDCWEMSAQVDYRKSPGLYPKRMPLKYQNIREPVYMPQQVPRSIHDLATNIDYLKPKNAQRIPPNARVRDARGPGGSGGPPIDPIADLTRTLVSQSTQTRSRPVSVSSAHAPATVDYTGATAEMDNLLDQLRQAEANLNMVEQMNIDVREGIQAGVAQMRRELEGPLAGTPPPMGTHTRFVEPGQVAEVPPYSPATVRQVSQELVREGNIMAMNARFNQSPAEQVNYQMAYEHMAAPLNFREPMAVSRQAATMLRSSISSRLPPRRVGIYTDTVGGQHGGMRPRAPGATRGGNPRLPPDNPPLPRLGVVPELVVDDEAYNRYMA